MLPNSRSQPKLERGTRSRRLARTGATDGLNRALCLKLQLHRISYSPSLPHNILSAFLGTVASGAFDIL